MKRNIQFILATIIILFFMVIFMDFTYISKLALWFIWASWSTIVAFMYAIVWRESVDCRCLKKGVREEKELGER